MIDFIFETNIYVGTERAQSFETQRRVDATANSCSCRQLTGDIAPTRDPRSYCPGAKTYGRSTGSRATLAPPVSRRAEGRVEAGALRLGKRLFYLRKGGRGRRLRAQREQQDRGALPRGAVGQLERGDHFDERLGHRRRALALRAEQAHAVALDEGAELRVHDLCLCQVRADGQVAEPRVEHRRVVAQRALAEEQHLRAFQDNMR
ncbi:hypothetical protein T492DRAFT_1148333 [Pavlovales sp. CCMP2436]|nr:hypothetical protein T492DRAFT_1148333 [Pavlovales sp. CCMP2436]